MSNRSLRRDRVFIGIISFLFLVAGVLSLLFFKLYRKYRRTSQKNEYLMQEQNHRAIGNLQQLSSLLSIQARHLSDTDARRAMEENLLRVQSMALIQKRLHPDGNPQSIDLTEYVPALANGVLHAYGHVEITTRYALEPIRLDPEHTVPLGLILTELVTNACKYAFPGSLEPNLTISCQRRQGQIELTVTDNGPGLDFDFSPRDEETTIASTHSYGMEMVRLQVRQLPGQYAFSESQPGGAPPGHGTHFTMNFNAPFYDPAQDSAHRGRCTYGGRPDGPARRRRPHGCRLGPRRRRSQETAQGHAA